MRVLDRISGRYILSGQQELGWDAYRVDEDIAYVEKTTGKTPVIRGLDFGDYTSEVGIRAEAQKRRAGNCVMISNPVSLATG